MRDDDHSPAAKPGAPVAIDAGTELENEPPVVARLVVEIRSDGSRTVARGAMEDVGSGQSVAIEARGDSPVQLALSLAKALFAAPSLARRAARGLLGRGRNSGRR